MYYPSNIEYLKTLQRRVCLDRGTPPRKGNLVFLLTPTREQSLNLASQDTNFYANGYMTKYFYPSKYNGMVGRKRFFYNHTKIRAALLKKVQEHPPLKMYTDPRIIKSNEKFSTFYDLSTYLGTYFMRTDTMSAFLKVKLFWQLFMPIFSDSYGQLKNKYVLVDASIYPLKISGNMKELVKNPLYLFYITMWKYMDMVKDLDVDFLIFGENRVLKINFSKIQGNDFRRYLIELRKLYKAVIPEPTPEEVKVEEDAAKVEEEKLENDNSNTVKVVRVEPKAVESVKIVERKAVRQVALNLAAVADSPDKKAAVASLHKLTDSLEDDEIVDNLSEGEASDEEDEVAEDEGKAKKKTEDDDVVEEKKKPEDNSEEESEEDEQEAIAKVYETLTKNTTPKSQRSSARDEMLREEQKKIQINGTTIEDLAKINPKEREIKSTDVSKTTYSANPNVKKVKFNNFNKTYVDECMTKDIVGVFENLNDKSIKMFIRGIDRKDSSTVTDLKETWTVQLEDEQRTRHTITVDIPKFYDKNFMWLGGNKRNIKNQLFLLPVVKISEDTVMIVSNYNKMTIQRVSGRSFVSTLLLTKIINKSEEAAKYFTPGSATGDNLAYITTLEYDDFAKSFLKFKAGKVTIWFDQVDAEAYMESHNIAKRDKGMFIGMNDKDPIFIDINTQIDDNGKRITDIILDALPEDVVKKFSQLQMHAPKTVAYSAITTMKHRIPLAVLICVWEGFAALLDKAKVDYKIAEKLTASTIGRNEAYIKFKDCFLVYKKSIPVELLMSGMSVIDTEKWTLQDMNKVTPYIPYIEKKYGKISILNALNNTYEFTIGPIEKELLLDLKLPTDIVSLLVYANKLLADRQYTSELNMSQYRLRSAEVLAAILYDTIAKAYVPYKNSSGKKKLSIPRDAVIKKLIALETVESTSTLNPFLELETTHGVSLKGWRGVNLEESYTVPKRCYDPSMIGIVGTSGSAGPDTGVSKTLTMEPNISSVRGYVNTTENLDELKDVNVFSPAELLIPLGATRDDPMRTGHSTKQSRASVPIENSSPVLMSNGTDENCKHYLSSDFVVMAEQDGEVIDYDENSKIMVVKYKDGTHRAVDLDNTIVKNGNGGFELSNQLTTDLKVGDKVKANETLAWHDKFFKKIPGQGVRMCVGALVKCALYSSYNTYEDATFITESMADKCATQMVHRISCVLGKHTNVFSMVREGEEVSTGQSLIEFDESFEEGDINALLDSLGDDEELKDVIRTNNRNRKKSDGGGVIDKIKIYSTCDLDELSPSLKKIVSKYWDGIKRKQKLLNNYDSSEGIVKCGVLCTETSEKTTPNRYGVIRGEKVQDGVLIEFYLKHVEPLEVGSKLANFSPLKNETGEIIPVGFEPRSEFRPNEVIETIISPTSILARMVGSVYPTIFGNKIIVEMKRALESIWIGPGDYASKRKKMLDIVYKTFDAMDPTKANTKKYQALFDPMNESKFRGFFKEFFENEYHYLIFEMVDYEVDLKIENIEKAAKVLGIPLYEYVTFPHFTMDKNNIPSTPHRIPVGYIHIKRPQQTVMHKNGMSTGTGKRAGITNQVTGEDKNGRESDMENCMLTSMGLNKTLKELNGPRADDSVAEKEMLKSISEKGYVNLNELTDDVSNKATLNAVNTYFLGMGLKTDLLTKGLKLPKNIDAE